MTNSIFVVGHKNPDNDSISAAVGYAYLKNELVRRENIRDANGEPVVYEPVRLGPMPPESAWVLDQVDIAHPRLIEHVRLNEEVSRGVKQRVILVDHNEVRQSVAGLEEAEVVEIIDHHRIADVTTAKPILFLNRPVGSTATIVAMECREYGVEIPRGLAKVLLSAILTDTVILKSPTATTVDRIQVDYLASLAGVEPLAFGLELFKHRGGNENIPIDRFVCADSKEFQARGVTVLIGQHETVDLPAALKREDEARSYMRHLCVEHNYEFVLLMITDIIAEGSQLLCEGDAEIVNRVLGLGSEEPGGKWMPGVLSRKKQIAGPILEA